MTLFIIIVAIIAILFLFINLVLAPHKPYQEKLSAFECGFHSFLQTRFPFNITFYIYGILFLLFDLEIFLVFPYAVSSYNNGIYGLTVIIVFLIIVTLGFIFELGKGALNIYTKQNTNIAISKHIITSSPLKGKIFPFKEFFEWANVFFKWAAFSLSYWGKIYYFQWFLFTWSDERLESRRRMRIKHLELAIISGNHLEQFLLATEIDEINKEIFRRRR
jgi:NADH-ubiquinone oxidoreductase chain 3